MRKESVKIWSYLGALFLFITMHNAYWLHKDFINPDWDEVSYLLNSLTAFDELRSHGFGALKQLYSLKYGVRPTFFFVILSLPFYALFGVTADVAILGTNTIFYAIIIIFTYRVARHFYSSKAALLATYATALSPGISSLSRIYWPHFSVVAVVVLGTYLLLKSGGFARKLSSLGFGVILGVGLMMRPIHPALFLFPPSLWTLFVSLRESVQTPYEQLKEQVALVCQSHGVFFRILKNVLLAMLIVLIIAGPYYISNYYSIINFSSSFQADYKSYPNAHPFWYILNLPTLVTPFSCLLLLTSFIWSFKRRTLAAGFLVFNIFAILIIISLPSFKMPYYFPPIVPFLSIASTYWIFDIRNVIVRKLLVAFTLFMSLSAFLVHAWGMPFLPNTFSQKVFPTRIEKPSSDNWHMPEIADIIRLNMKSNSIPSVGFVTPYSSYLEPTFRYLGGPKTKSFSYIYPHDNLKTLLAADFVVVTKYNIELAWLKNKPKPLPEFFRFGRKEAILIVHNPKSVFYKHHYRVGPSLRVNDVIQMEVYARKDEQSPQEIVDVASEMIALDPEPAVQQLNRILKDASFQEVGFCEAIKSSINVARKKKKMSN